MSPQQTGPCRRVQERAERTQLNARDRATGFFVEASDKVTERPRIRFRLATLDPAWYGVRALVHQCLLPQRGDGCPVSPPCVGGQKRRIRRQTVNFHSVETMSTRISLSFLRAKSTFAYMQVLCLARLYAPRAREGCIVSIVSTAMTGRNNAVNRGDDRAARIVDTVSTLPRLRRLRAAWRIGYGAGMAPLSRLAAQPASHARCLRWCPRRFVQVDDLVEARSCRHVGGFRGSLLGRRAFAAYGDVDGPSAATHRPWSSTETARVLRRSAARARAHGWAGTRRVRRGGAGRVG